MSQTYLDYKLSLTAFFFPHKNSCKDLYTCQQCNSEFHPCVFTVKENCLKKVYFIASQMKNLLIQKVYFFTSKMKKTNCINTFLANAY